MKQNDFASSVDLDNLTESQRKAVLHIDGPLLVLAGPGSGKTRVITSRIAALVNAGVKPWNICAVTFTNKAADEMRQRVMATGTANGVHVSTFHSLCVRILRQYGQPAGIKPNFSIYSDDDQKRCVKNALASCNVDAGNFQPARILNAISRCKNDLQDASQLEAEADDYFTKTLAKIYRSYQAQLADNNALDFDDLLVRTALLLRDEPDIRHQLSQRFQYLLVDEYQDTNHAQYQIAKGLALEHGNICVTGDPDQSIYRWRGADIENILVFERDWPNATVVRLEENFRSQPRILTLADKLIAFNTKRKEKSLIATRPDGDDVVFKACSDETDEADFAASSIQQLIQAGTDPNEVAIFYRVNSMSRVIEEAFIRRQIPYQVVRGVEFYSRKETRDMLGYLKLIANPDDDMAFLRAINTHPRGIGKTTQQRLGAYAVQSRISLLAAARQVRSTETISKVAQGRLAAFAAMIDKFAKDAAGPVALLMKTVFEQSGYADNLDKGGEKGQDAADNVRELINAAAAYDEAAEAPSLVDWLQTIALYSDTDAYDANSPVVSLMTLHAAKGLEFGHAFIIGAEDGLLPHERSIGHNANADELEEERRLFFVGITRARDHLTISHARHRMIHGQFLRTMPSQFLYEVGYSDSFQDDWPSQDDVLDVDSGDAEYADDSDNPSPRKKGTAFRVNELVRHDKFGLGRIKEFLDMGDDSIVVVHFNSGRTKSLMTRYAKLERVST